MAISGLVLITEPDTRRAAEALARIRRDPRFTLGPPNGRRIPIVLETASQDEDREGFHWLTGLDGIAHVDVVLVGIDEATESSPGETIQVGHENAQKTPKGLTQNA